MNIFFALTLMFFFLLIVLSLFMLISNKQKEINVVFALVSFSTAGWILSNYFIDNISNLDAAMLWTRLTFVFTALVAYFMLIFAFMFPFAKKSTRFKRYVYWGLPAVGIIISMFTPLIVAGVKPSGQIVEMIFGPGIYLYMLYLGVYFLTALVVLISKYRKTTGRYRKQLQMMFFGFGLSSTVSLVTNLGLPAFFGNNSLVIFGPFSVVFLLGFTAYAIVKHRMMDIKMVVARSVTYSILVVSMAAIYAGGVFAFERILFPGQNTLNMGQMAVRTVLAVVMAFSFQPLRRWITKVTDKVFFKEAYNTEELLDVVAHTVGSTIILIEMLYKTLDILIKNMRITRGVIVVFSDTGTVLESQSAGYKVAPKLVAKDLVAMAHDGVLVADELADSSKFKKMLAHYDSSVCVPLKTDAGTEGVLLLGEKQSGDMYSQNDLKVLEIIAPEVAVATTNAKSYEKIERFNVTLRQEVKKATHELEKKNEQLRELDKAKDEFISMASHQLRTPLTAIKGYLSMLLEGDAGEIKVSQYDFVNEAFSGANRMVGLINDLLNVSRMETGRFFLEPVEVDMEKLVNEEYKQLVNHAKEKGLKFELKVVGKIPKVWVDETKIRQVVMNFTDNALYYTTAGSVTVHLKADKKNIIFEVSDTGIGVPKNQQKNLFTKFYRADNARHVRPDGTGLGIYLAKRVMDDHGGELIFHSVEGKGSTFGFKLPIKSKLKMKRVSAPEPANRSSNSGIGELAAGVGVPVETLEATQAAGIEAPLPDSSDKKDLDKAAKEIKKDSK